jgi:hypothetical protein
VAEMDKAKSEILVQAYSFTPKPIASALVDAHKRGVHTEIILDKSNIRDEYSAIFGRERWHCVTAGYLICGLLLRLSKKLTPLDHFVPEFCLH